MRGSPRIARATHAHTCHCPAAFLRGVTLPPLRHAFYCAAFLHCPTFHAAPHYLCTTHTRCAFAVFATTLPPHTLLTAATPRTPYRFRILHIFFTITGSTLFWLVGWLVPRCARCGSFTVPRTPRCCYARFLYALCVPAFICLRFIAAIARLVAICLLRTLPSRVVRYHFAHFTARCIAFAYFARGSSILPVRLPRIRYRTRIPFGSAASRFLRAPGVGSHALLHTHVAALVTFTLLTTPFVSLLHCGCCNFCIFARRGCRTPTATPLPARTTLPACYAVMRSRFHRCRNTGSALYRCFPLRRCYALRLPHCRYGVALRNAPAFFTFLRSLLRYHRSLFWFTLPASFPICSTWFARYVAPPSVAVRLRYTHTRTRRTRTLAHYRSSCVATIPFTTCTFSP